ncbi:hypothetical protein [Gluconobacter sphaericus]|uniref:hypothetical protein n=1 Tax=Gluconobacter sphaericus TaxID=574987 RepID=UPI00312B6E73
MMWDSPQRKKSGMTFSGKGEALRIGDAVLQAIGHAALLLFSGSVLWGGRERGMKPELLSGTASLLLLTFRAGLSRPSQP